MTRGSSQNDASDPPDSVDPKLDAILREFTRFGIAPPLLPQPGQIVGDKYRIEERLGRGGMGAVFLATHLLSQKRVAIKWMLRAPDERGRKRFLREARVAGRVDHPNVVNIYDVGQQGDSSFLVLELLHGENLRDRLRRGPVSVAQALDILLPAMRGVEALHRAGVIHRDLKPDNIFLCTAPDGTPREAKVLDFGVSALTAREDGDTTLTQDGAVLGTPAYMAPEQLMNSKSTDERADVYALGVVLYEALTGERPFEADSYPELLLAIVQRDPKPPRQIRPDVSQDLEAILLRTLSKQPAARFASVDDLILALQPIANASSTQTALQVRRLRTVRRSAHRLLALPALCASAVLCMLWFWSAAGQPAAQKKSAEPRQPAPTMAEPERTVAWRPVQSVPALTPPATQRSVHSEPNAPAAVSEAGSTSSYATGPARARRPRIGRTSKKPPGLDSTPPSENSPRSGRISVDDL